MKKILSVFCLFGLLMHAGAQQTDKKNYPSGTMAGDVYLVNTYGEISGSIASRVFNVTVRTSNYYYISALVNMDRSQGFKIYVDNSPFEYLRPSSDGWQFSAVNSSFVKLAAGSHVIRVYGTNTMVPMVEELFLTLNPSAGKQNIPVAVSSFLDKAEQMRNMPVLTARENIEAVSPSKVLPNPEGEYAHAMDTAFVYSHYSQVYLTPGNYTFTTSGSTVSRSLAVYRSSDYAQSSANVNGGPGGESYVPISVPSAAYYTIMLRPTSSGASGTTNILQNGSTIVANAVVGGKYYSTSTLRGGDQNFFTCKITGDTRIFTSRYASSSIRGYNDDYYGGGGNWNWGLASRIKKNFNGVDSVQYTFVCAYSPSSTGICDIYMGCGNSNLHQLEPLNFPNLTDDDAIRSAPSSGTYNCIAWSGGITTSWVWPPYSLSTYSCSSGNVLQCFDNYYSNNPVRYPGAWNYTRTGATSANSVVDLWKRPNGDYQHASVLEPGNNHPHGYDWESKPGGTNRTFHPRNALENVNWYGVITNYYKPTGTYARATGVEVGIKSDMDAVNAGLAIIDKAVLTEKASDKLGGLVEKIDPSLTRRFEELYKMWDATKVANGSLSNPSMYCQNREYKALEAFAMTNPRACMLIVFDKFVNKEDHLLGDLLVTLTKEKYGKLLDEVKSERLANPYDKDGRYRIHGDHDNGVLYIEKILKELQEDIIPEPVADALTVTVSPNPVADKMTVQFVTKKESKVSIVVVSAQTGMKQVLQKETILSSGTHRFETSVKDIAGSSGNMLAVQVTVDGVMKTVKVMVMK